MLHVLTVRADGAGLLLQDLHEQLDDKDDFEDSAHLDKESWGEFFALHQ